ncbi:hypothetical protein L6452_21524 [Arctium lappa]|uniref:Uncharacterized protein n=1 Tax=Arctium lappa TaxID=4217 RepID=A0ACB9AXM2_ARCLA|nr:hypothetical protein L6452_21524 [Arctium lappa]
MCVLSKSRENLHFKSEKKKKKKKKLMEHNNGGSFTVTGGEFTGSEEVENIATWLFAMDNDDDDDDDATELSKVLEAMAEKTFPMKVKIIDNPPCWHPLIFQTAASYVTINGNEESCGSSFSDSDTSYMAGISGGGPGGGGLVVGDGGAWECVVEEARGWMETEEDGNCLVNFGLTGGGYCDDEMLAKFLGGGFEEAR